MSNSGSDYAPLTVETLPQRLSSVAEVSTRLGSDASSWQVREVGDGNLNLVFIVESPLGAIVVKQALPYVRLVGDSWPLPLSRSYFEFNALVRQAERAPGMVPELYYFDRHQALLVMEFLSPHHILRHSLMRTERHEGLGAALGEFCADTLFKGSDLCMDAAKRKADVALFAGNVALCDITESLVFTDPFYPAPMNRHTSPQLDDSVQNLRADTAAKVAAQDMKYRFCSRAETLLHGDLHTGSVMVSGKDVKVIDPEFALYGPMGFDIGMLMANFLMAWFAQPGHVSDDQQRDAYQRWILETVSDIWTRFQDRFETLWAQERNGMLYPEVLFDRAGESKAVRQACDAQLVAIWEDAMGFCGAEMIRRILGLAHIAEFEEIEDADLRGHCERGALALGRELLVNRQDVTSLQSLFDQLKRATAQEPLTS